MEFALVFPVLATLFLGVIDFGVYVTAFISVQNAARAAALRNSGGRSSAADQTSACKVARDQLRGLPGVNASTTCLAAPLTVSSLYCPGTGTCGTLTATADGKAAALVTVSYRIPDFFRVPIVGPQNIIMRSQMKLRSYE